MNKKVNVQGLSFILFKGVDINEAIDACGITRKEYIDGCLGRELESRRRKKAWRIKVIADKAIADKAMADKAIADKALADKALAERIANRLYVL